MYIDIKKIKGMEIKRNWFFIGALLLLTITATVFFIFQKNANDVGTGEKSVIQEQQVEAGGQRVPDSDPVSEPQKEVLTSSPAVPAQDIVMKWPGDGEIICPFGFVHSETFNDLRFHTGVDIALPPGYEVRAALPGTVVSISANPLWGYEIAIKHGEKLETRYKGVKPIKTEVGYEVAKGDIIGQVTTSPKYEAKMPPHLHFEVYEYGKAVDPMKHL